jgi:putative nucleotidyltransferase with HDIG domain
MNMPDHIVAHCLQVSRVAAVITDLLAQQRIYLNRDLILASAMLHDITKSRSLMTGENHASTGAELMAELGYPEIGKIILQHVQLQNYSDNVAPQEEEIVNYSDKRVIHDSIASLEERCNYILERYGTVPIRRKLINQMFSEARVLEKRLFRLLPIAAEELALLIVPPDCNAELEAYRKTANS